MASYTPRARISKEVWKEKLSFYLRDCEQVFSQVILLKLLGDETQLPTIVEWGRHSSLSSSPFLLLLTCLHSSTTQLRHHIL